MKKEIKLLYSHAIPYILAVSCGILLLLSEPAQNEKFIIVLIIFILSFEISRLNNCVNRFRKLFNEQNQEFETALKHELKIPAIAQIRAIELLLSGHFGKFSVKQRRFFYLMLESEKKLFEIINNRILVCSQNIEMIYTIK